MTKFWMKSKLLWINVLTLAASLLAVLEGNDWIAQNPRLTAAIGVAIGFVNVILRTITSARLTLRR